ncbi:MAG: hypothetical protein ACR2L1_03090 [Pyrinomonadaceae bacterium]
MSNGIPVLDHPTLEQIQKYICREKNIGLYITMRRDGHFSHFCFASRRRLLLFVKRRRTLFFLWILLRKFLSP